MAEQKDLEHLISQGIRMPKGIDLEFPMPALSIPRNALLEAAESNYASEFYERLGKLISTFDASLDEEHEVGVRLVSFGQTVVFHLRGMGYWNPSLISFQGVTDDGSPVDLIQHVTQISILLMKVHRQDTSKPKKPIFGFGGEPKKAAP
jgi:Family of unknown function (DUF6173)